MTKVVLTGGSGDLGTLLTDSFTRQGYEVVNLDLSPSPYQLGATFIQGSVLEMKTLAQAMKSADIVIHIAGLHGIHLAQGKAQPEDFQAVNVDGTRNVFQAAKDAGIERVVHISTSDVHDGDPDIYGQSKIDAEAIAEDFAVNQNMRVISLRPRAFIPPWSESAYPDPKTRFRDWSDWFLKGAVHLQDVGQAVEKAVLCLKQGHFAQGLVFKSDAYEAFDIDGTYECTEQDLKDVEALGFTKKPVHHPEEWRTRAETYLGYKPTYSVRDFIGEWQKYKGSAPPNPFKKNDNSRNLNL